MTDLIRRLLEEFSDVNWFKGPAEDELEEFQRCADELGLSADELVAAYSRASLSVLDPADWARLENTDSWDIRSDIELRTLCKVYEKDSDPIMHALTHQGSLPAPIVLRYGDRLTLVAGNTRLMCCKLRRVTPNVVIITI